MAATRAIVVGSGPNGLAAAVTLARAGLDVTVLERANRIGGGSTTAELTLPGFRHDVCSAVHPIAAASEFFRRFRLADRVDLLTPEISYAHAIEPGVSAVAWRDLQRTVDGLGADGPGWRRLLGGLARTDVASLLAGPLAPFQRLGAAVPFGVRLAWQGAGGWNAGLGPRAASLFSGVVAHSIQPMPAFGAAAAGLVLATLAHTVGWPVPRGGSGAIVDALVADLLSHGGRVETGVEVGSLAEVADARVVMLDVTPRAFVRLASGRLDARQRRPYERFRYGPGVAKVDFALREPVPWADPALSGAVTVHLGGTREQIAAAEREVAAGRMPEHPFVLTSQPTLIDPARAPGHVLWAYAHVPSGSPLDATELVTAEVERYAPGFRDLIIGTHAESAVDMERRNPNYVGGDIAAGAASTRQLLTRPRVTADPWSTPLPGVYLCSASTSPGPGVHGMSGWLAARRALDRLGVPEPELAP